MSDIYVISTVRWIDKKDKFGEPVSPVKIGVTKNIKARLSCLRTASPYPLCLMHVFKFPDMRIAYTLEQEFLDSQSKFRMNGEWLNLNPRLVLALLCYHIQNAIMNVMSGWDGDRSFQYFDKICNVTKVSEAINKFNLIQIYPDLDIQP